MSYYEERREGNKATRPCEAVRGASIVDFVPFLGPNSQAKGERSIATDGRRAKVDKKNASNFKYQIAK
jgi:hypothetical protein